MLRLRGAGDTSAGAGDTSAGAGDTVDLAPTQLQLSFTNQPRVAFLLAVGMVYGERCGLLVRMRDAAGCMLPGGVVDLGEEPFEAAMREFALQVGFNGGAARARQELEFDNPRRHTWRGYPGITFVVPTPRLLEVAQLARANIEASGALIVKLAEFSDECVADQRIRPALLCVDGETSPFAGETLSLRNHVGDAVAALAIHLLADRTSMQLAVAASLTQAVAEEFARTQGTTSTELANRYQEILDVTSARRASQATFEDFLARIRPEQEDFFARCEVALHASLDTATFEDFLAQCKVEQEDFLARCEVALHASLDDLYLDEEDLAPAAATATEL